MHSSLFVSFLFITTTTGFCPLVEFDLNGQPLTRCNPPPQPQPPQPQPPPVVGPREPDPDNCIEFTGLNQKFGDCPRAPKAPKPGNFPPKKPTIKVPTPMPTRPSPPERTPGSVPPESPLEPTLETFPPFTSNTFPGPRLPQPPGEIPFTLPPIDASRTPGVSDGQNKAGQVGSIDAETKPPLTTTDTTVAYETTSTHKIGHSFDMHKRKRPLRGPPTKPVYKRF